MATAAKRKHTHRRSSSLLEATEKSLEVGQTSLVTSISSQETMKLIEESQNKSEFQIIVDSFEAELPISPPSAPSTPKKQVFPRQLPAQSLLSDYFCIESLECLRTNNIKENINLRQLGEDKLGMQPKENSRLRYHVNVQLKAFKDANKKLFFKNSSNFSNLYQFHSNKGISIKA